MFYNYLIFNMVTLSLRILLKYCVSLHETIRFTPGNFLFQTGMKLSASNLRLSFYIFFKKKVLAVEYGIRKEINPVSKYQHT